MGDHRRQLLANNSTPLLPNLCPEHFEQPEWARKKGEVLCDRVGGTPQIYVLRNVLVFAAIVLLVVCRHCWLAWRKPKRRNDRVATMIGFKPVGSSRKGSFPLKRAEEVNDPVHIAYSDLGLRVKDSEWP